MSVENKMYSLAEYNILTTSSNSSLWLAPCIGSADVLAFIEGLESRDHLFGTFVLEFPAEDTTRSMGDFQFQPVSFGFGSFSSGEG